MNDIEIVKLMEKQIDPSYLEGTELFLQENTAKSSYYNSVMIKSPKTLYRSVASGNKSIFYCRIKNNKNLRYISFPAEYEKDFEEAGFSIDKIRSEPDFIRIDIDNFVNNIDNAGATLNKIFKEALSFPAFGCCSKYKECSIAEKCLHDDQIYATACMYRKNLESGKNFYKEV